MNPNYQYNNIKRLLILFDESNKPFFAQSGPQIAKFMDKKVSNYEKKCMKIHTKNTLEQKIKELNEWIINNPDTEPDYKLKIHDRNYYVNKLLDLVDSGLMVIRA